MSVQRQHCLDRDVDTAEVIPLEHDLAHPFSVFQWVHGRFSKEDFAARGVDFHFLVEGIVPQMIHVVPDLYNSIFHLHTDQNPLDLMFGYDARDMIFAALIEQLRPRRRTLCP